MDPRSEGFGEMLVYAIEGRLNDYVSGEVRYCTNYVRRHLREIGNHHLGRMERSIRMVLEAGGGHGAAAVWAEFLEEVRREQRYRIDKLTGKEP